MAHRCVRCADHARNHHDSCLRQRHAGRQLLHRWYHPATSVGGDPNPFVVNYNETIYRGGTSAMCPTCLDFVANFSNVAITGNDPILEFTIASFIDPIVAGTGTLAPTQALMTVNGVLNFGYDGNTGVLPGESSDTLVAYTDQTNFQLGGLTFQDGATANDPGFVPAPSVAVTPGTQLADAARNWPRQRRRRRPP